jgi:hypothetical protein
MLNVLFKFVILLALVLPVVSAEEVWWSLKPLQQPAVPAVRGTAADWARNPIDNFIARTHTQRKLSPAPEADRRTLIRRLYYDLTGLPPTPEVVEAFVRDKRPDAYERIVDELLASPRYGERWARHWLDVVHYGDTHGYDKDKLRRNAWPYRDYVINSFNQDTPYSRFIQEQLAGDVLDETRPDLVAATGFIVAGPWDFIGHVEVPGSKIDGKVARNLDRDDMVVNTIQTFNSSTVQCARCHDHKFDPFTKEDYYSLQAVFAAIGRNDRPVEMDPGAAERRRNLEKQQRGLQAKAGELRKQRDSRSTPEIKKLDKQLADLAKSQPAVQKIDSPRSDRYGFHSHVAKSANTAKWVQIDLGKRVKVDKVMLFAANEWGTSDFGFPQAYKVEGSNKADFSRGVTLHSADEKTPRPGGLPVVMDGKNAHVKFIRITASKLWNRRHPGKQLTDDWIFALGEVIVLADGANVARGKSVTAADSIEAGERWGKKNVTDGVLNTHTIDQFRKAIQPVGGKSPSNGYHSHFTNVAETEKWVQLDLGESKKLGRVMLYPAFPTDWKDTPGFGFPLRFKVEASNDATFAAATTLLSETGEDYPNPGNTPVVVEAGDTSARYVRLTATKLWDRGGKSHALALAEMTVGNDGKLAHKATVTASDTTNTGRWNPKFVTDGYNSRGPLGSDGDFFSKLAPDPALASKIAALTTTRAELVHAALPDGHADGEAKIAAELDAIQKQLQQLPQPQMVYAAATHFKAQANHKPTHGKPKPIHVLARGQVTKPGELVGPRALRIPGLEADLSLADGHDESARRLALANWIIDRNHPLTWRSIVNRIWQYHFGQGIVGSPNDFGMMGQKPTHPQLLDWLAVEFRDGGQSFKKLHKLMVTSAAYRQAATHDAADAALDSSNQYLWRMNRRRLAAEEIRDSILLLSGKLSTEMYGPGFFDFKLEKATHSPHYQYHKPDPNDPKTHRRSIYRFIVRSQPQPFMTTMDCADPSMSVPARTETLTALQALAMFNNPFVIAMSTHFAESAKAKGATIEEQTRYLLARTLSRPATDAEVAQIVEFAKAQGLESAARALFNSNEFLFVE